MDSKTIEEIEDELDQIQIAYIDEDDEFIQLDLERKFSYLLDEATAIDGILRTAAGITITNWVRDT